MIIIGRSNATRLAWAIVWMWNACAVGALGHDGVPMLACLAVVWWYVVSIRTGVQA